MPYAAEPGAATMLTDDMIRIVREQRLGFVATVSPDGTPNVSPKGTFVVLDERTIAFSDIRSPATLRNLTANPAVEVNFVDPFARKGYRFAGRARIVRKGEDGFEALVARFAADYAEYVPKMRAVVAIDVTNARPLVTPGYDLGHTEDGLRRAWTRRFRSLQPGGEFAE